MCDCLVGCVACVECFASVGNRAYFIYTGGMQQQHHITRLFEIRSVTVGFIKACIERSN